MKRNSFSIIPVQNGGYRLLDNNFSSYIFVGDNNEEGLYTLYSVPIEKFNNNKDEWEKRTIFDIKQDKESV